MKMKNITLILTAALALTGCGSRDRQLDEAVDFLYEYMSIADKGDYSEEFFRDNAEIALKARHEMPWGGQVSNQLFRHFVLPLRVNNERLDDFRTMYYDTLKARVAGLSMHDAALEINHWCHEKVTYAPSDARTSSPLACIRNGEGRCGEESTFTVAAMRTVGIPARQVYTPRWAHTDDNHAWVEVWTDGKWSFIGACEPEPELNMAWFNEPATRAMLMHTLVFGDYTGPEDVIRRTHNFTEINVVGNYVKTRLNTVTVNDSEGNPVKGAKVGFCIYNYGEMYPAVTLATDNEGKASLHTGLGDVFVWAYANGRYGTGMLHSEVSGCCGRHVGSCCGKKVACSKGNEESIETVVTLDHTDEAPMEMDIDITPPAPGKIPAEASEEAIARNKARLAYEDSLRLAYTSTFTTMDNARQRLGMPDIPEPAAEEACRQLVDAKGNWLEIRNFIEKANGCNRLRNGLEMLKTLSRKDIRDTRCDVLMDALTSAARPNAISGEDESIYFNYVLCPRISGEFIQPYHTEIWNALSAYIYGSGTPREVTCSSEAEVLSDKIIAWSRDSIIVADSLNTRMLQATPAGVLKLRMADMRSRDIFTVAALRTFGIPSRIDQMTGKAQYLTGNDWLDIMMDKDNASSLSPAKGSMTMKYTPGKGTLDNPEYYRHFTLSRIKDGQRRLLDFEGGDATELGADVSARSFSTPFTLDAGSYLLTSGTRLASGKVLARLVTFNVRQGGNTEVQLLTRESNEDISVIGAMEPEALYRPVEIPCGNVNAAEAEASAKSILSTTGRGYFLVAVFGDGDEPSNHAIRDIVSMSSELKSWGRPVMVFGQNMNNTVNLYRQLCGGASRDGSPLNSSQVNLGIDADSAISDMLCNGCHSPSRTLPVIAMCDSFGRVVFLSTGYNTSLATQLCTVLAGI